MPRKVKVYDDEPAWKTTRREESRYVYSDDINGYAGHGEVKMDDTSFEVSDEEHYRQVLENHLDHYTTDMTVNDCVRAWEMREIPMLLQSLRIYGALERDSLCDAIERFAESSGSVRLI